MKIIRARLKPMAGTTYEFISVKGRIKAVIEKNRGDNFDFVIDDKSVKAIKSFGPDFINELLVGKTIPIIDNTYFAKFNKDGTIDITDGSVDEGALPRESTVSQLKKLRKLTKKTDIGDRTSNGILLNQIGNSKNPIDQKGPSRIESYEDFQRRNKKFNPSWNLRNLKPFKD